MRTAARSTLDTSTSPIPTLMVFLDHATRRASHAKVDVSLFFGGRSTNKFTRVTKTLRGATFSAATHSELQSSTASSTGPRPPAWLFGGPLGAKTSRLG